MSNTRYWLLVLLIPLGGLLLLGGLGAVELALWLALAVMWAVAFINDGLERRVTLAGLGVLVVLGAGMAVYNHTMTEGSSATVERD